MKLKISRAIILIIVFSFMITVASCFKGNASSTTSVTSTVLKPMPKVESVIAATSGTEAAYFTTLDIKVRNDGAEGTILVLAEVTQNGKSNQEKMSVFLQEGESHELKLTFPLVWQGGAFTQNVQTIVP
jgi:hypothetical protein